MPLSPLAAIDRSFLLALIDHIAHPIFVKDREYRFVVVNRALAEMIGVETNDLIGKTDYDFFPKREADFFRAKDQEMFATAASIVIEEEPMTDVQGARHLLSTTKVPLRDTNGSVTHLVGIIHDITRLKTAEEQLRLVNEMLEARVVERTHALEAAQAELVKRERLAVLGQLAGGLAHQIRNPLSAITNAAYVLKRLVGGGPDGDAAKAVNIIHEEAWQANRIITDLLDYARLRVAVPRPTDPTTLVGAAVRRHPLPAGIELHAELAALPAVSVDPDQVVDALANLIQNAVDAMPQGGRIDVTGVEDRGAVVLSVRDSGRGIDEEVRTRLFEPLVTTKASGRGLGLTTARALVENQGGTITAFSEPGHGARFDVRLPKSAPDEPRFDDPAARD